MAAQAAAFQDKTISLRPKATTTGALGSKTLGPGSVSATYLANLQIISDQVLAQEWGLQVGKDAFMTRSTTAPIVQADYVQYEIGRAHV